MAETTTEIERPGLEKMDRAQLIAFAKKHKAWWDARWRSSPQQCSNATHIRCRLARLWDGDPPGWSKSGPRRRRGGATPQRRKRSSTRVDAGELPELSLEDLRVQVETTPGSVAPPLRHKLLSAAAEIIGLLQGIRVTPPDGLFDGLEELIARARRAE